MIYINIPTNKKLEIIKKHKNYCNLYVKPRLEQFKNHINELYIKCGGDILKKYPYKLILILLDELLNKFDIISVGNFEELVKLIMYDYSKEEESYIVTLYRNAYDEYNAISTCLVKYGYKNNLKDQLRSIYNYEMFSKGNTICCVAESYIKIQKYLNEELNNKLGSLRSKKDLKSLEKKREIFIEILNDILSVNDEDININRNSINEKINKLYQSNKERVDDFQKYLTNLSNNIRNNDSTKWSAYKLVKTLDIDVCPYCNRKYITTIESKKGGRYRAELDHFIPKSKFPFFSLSLFNLIPSCGVCNSSLKKASNFIPTTKKEYEEFIKLDENIEFTTISPYSKILKKYEEKKLFKFDLGNSNKNKYKIVLSYADEVDKEIIRLMNNFFIKEIYRENHNDILEDIYIKKNLMHSEYIKSICKYIKNELNLSDDYINQIIDRVFFGYYLNSKSHSKRPLNKLAYDLLKEEN